MITTRPGAELPRLPEYGRGAPAPRSRAPRNPGVRRWLRGAREAVLITVVAFAAICVPIFGANTPKGVPPPSALETAWLNLAVAAGLGLSIALVWRMKRPVLLTLVAAGVTLALPTDASAALIGLACVILTSDRVTALRCGALVAVATYVSVLRDGLRPAARSFLWVWVGEGSLAGAQPVGVAVSMLVATALLVCAVGIGLLLRSRRDLASSKREVSVVRATSDELSHELARQEERDVLAREVHDALGHRLSLISLHAGALELASQGTELSERAALVRSNASQSMADLRSLLGVLRDPGGAAPGTATGVTPLLQDLPSVVDDAVQAGALVTSAVYIEDAERAPANLARAVYRIVQELLTNARRHAPGEPLRLTVRGSAANGVSIDAVNRRGSAGNAAAGAGGGASPGRGLTGIGERAALLGGRAHYGLVAPNSFRVEVWLPWDAQAAPPGHVGGLQYAQPREQPQP